MNPRISFSTRKAMIRRSSTAVLVASLMVVAAACGGGSGGSRSPGVTDKKILIGAYAGISGPAALSARDVIRGMELAFDEVNGAGGVHGRTIALKVRDDTYDPAKAVSVARDLVQNDKVFAMTGLGTPSTLAVDKFLASQRVPNLFPLAGASQLYEPPTGWTFIAQPAYKAQAYISVKHGIEKRGVKKLGILALNDESGGDVAAGCAAAAKDLGIEIVGKHTFEPTATNFSAQLTDLRSKGADGLCLGSLLEIAALQLKQAKQLNWRPVWMSFGGIADPALAELAGGNEVAEGVVAVGNFRPTSSDDLKVVAFVDKFKAEHGIASPSFYNVYGYWAGHLISEALQDAGKNVTRESLRTALLGWDAKVPSTGLSGPITFSEKQPNGLNSMFVLEMRAGQFVAVTDAVTAPADL